VIISSVTILLKPCCPATVGRFVISAVVNSVKRMLRTWLASHVGKESGEAVSPAVTHSKAAATVIGILLTLGIVAAVQHIVVDAVFNTYSGRAVVDCVRTTPTSCRPTCSEPVHCHKSLVPTLASAQPVILAVMPVAEPQYNPCAEYFARAILDSCAGDGRIIGSHDVNPCIRFAIWLEPIGRTTALLARFIIHPTT